MSTPYEGYQAEDVSYPRAIPAYVPQSSSPVQSPGDQQDSTQQSSVQSQVNSYAPPAGASVHPNLLGSSPTPQSVPQPTPQSNGQHAPQQPYYNLHNQQPIYNSGPNPNSQFQRQQHYPPHQQPPHQHYPPYQQYPHSQQPPHVFVPPPNSAYTPGQRAKIIMEHKLFACEDPAVCLLAYCFGPCVAAYTQYRVEGMCSAIITFFFYPFIGACNRTTIKMATGTLDPAQDSCCTNCLLHFFCSPCALAQEHSAIEAAIQDGTFRTQHPSAPVPYAPIMRNTYPQPYQPQNYPQQPNYPLQPSYPPQQNYPQPQAYNQNMPAPNNQQPATAQVVSPQPPASQ